MVRWKRLALGIFIVAIWLPVVFYFFSEKAFNRKTPLKDLQHSAVNKNRLSALEEILNAQKRVLRDANTLNWIPIETKQMLCSGDDSDFHGDAKVLKEIRLKFGDALKNMCPLIRQNVGRSNEELNGPSVAIVVFACNRKEVTRTLDQLIRIRPKPTLLYPVIVSQDCGHAPTAELIRNYVSTNNHMYHITQPNLTNPVVAQKFKKFAGYYKIARHYKFALDTVFMQYSSILPPGASEPQAVIILEDDLDLSTDIFEYFLATLPLLMKDKTLWCVSAWNDNGKDNLIDNSPQGGKVLYRSDFFPGLGWMMLRSLWVEELSPKWPTGFWDDWLREPVQRQERVCIRPEIPRTATFGKIGVSKGLFFEKHLKFIHAFDGSVDWRSQNLSYLLQSNYDPWFMNEVYSSPVVSVDAIKGNRAPTGTVRIEYITMKDYKGITKALGLMEDFKSGVPRTAYRGIVALFYSNRQRIFVAPPRTWTKYDTSWA